MSLHRKRSRPHDEPSIVTSLRDELTEARALAAEIRVLCEQSRGITARRVIAILDRANGAPPAKDGQP